MTKLLRKFHESCLLFGQQEKSMRKAKKNRTSLSDYFNGSFRKSPGNGFNSMVNPLLTKINVNQEETKNSIGDITMTDQEDEHNFILDIEMMYGKQSDSQILNIERQDKECIKQILVDVMDLSMNEYSMHYILHSENEYMTPFRDLKNRLKEELFEFYKSSCESIPFKIWSEIISEHCITLSSFLPNCLLKELHEHRLSFVKKYTKNRIKHQLKKFTEKSKKNKEISTSQSMRVFSSNSAIQDPTEMTADEYLEMTLSEFINTPFQEYLSSRLKKSTKSNLLSLLAYIKENEVDIITIYNSNFEAFKKFSADTKFKNNVIEKYKSVRGFPLKLSPSESILYSMDEEITFHILEKLKDEREKERKQREQVRIPREDEFSCYSNDTESCDEEIPFVLETNKTRASHPEKRSPKFDPFSSLRLMKSCQPKDDDMDVEESKSELFQVQKCERPSLGSISVLFKCNQENTNNLFTSSPFGED